MSNWDDIPEIFDVKTLAKFLGIGTNSAYDLCHRADFPTVYIGKMMRITKVGLEEWLRSAAISR